MNVHALSSAAAALSQDVKLNSNKQHNALRSDRFGLSFLVLVESAKTKLKEQIGVDRTNIVVW